MLITFGHFSEIPLLGATVSAISVDISVDKISYTGKTEVKLLWFWHFAKNAAGSLRRARENLFVFNVCHGILAKIYRRLSWLKYQKLISRHSYPGFPPVLLPVSG